MVGFRLQDLRFRVCGLFGLKCLNPPAIHSIHFCLFLVGFFSRKKGTLTGKGILEDLDTSWWEMDPVLHRV